MSVLKRLLQEPVVHFVIAGILLYGLALLFRGEDLNPRRDTLIEVDDKAILNFIQYRNNAFDAQRFSDYISDMSASERQQLVDEYIAEELLYREAMTLGLDQSDYIIRQRMVEKMRFLLSDLAGGELKPSDEALRSYLKENLDAYRVSPAVTFTHVYFDIGRHGESEGKRLAVETLERLNSTGAGFNDAGGEGDRFPFLRNYVERTLSYVEGHFGTTFVEQLQQIEAGGGTWQGPLRSAYGYHLVLLDAFSRSREPSLEEVRHELEQDYIQEHRRKVVNDMTNSLRKQYEIRITL